MVSFGQFGKFKGKCSNGCGWTEFMNFVNGECLFNVVQFNLWSFFIDENQDRWGSRKYAALIKCSITEPQLLCLDIQLASRFSRVVSPQQLKLLHNPDIYSCFLSLIFFYDCQIKFGLLFFILLAKLFYIIHFLLGNFFSSSILYNTKKSS